MFGIAKNVGSAASARKGEQKRSRGLSVRGEPIGSAEAHLTLHG